MSLSYEVPGSLRLAHHDGCGRLRFDVDPDDDLPQVGDEIHVRDLDGCEAWGEVLDVTTIADGHAITFRPSLATAP